eukprot:Gb_23868 [translate_table: standard]
MAKLEGSPEHEDIPCDFPSILSEADVLSSSGPPLVSLVQALLSDWAQAGLLIVPHWEEINIASLYAFLKTLISRHATDSFKNGLLLSESILGLNSLVGSQSGSMPRISENEGSDEQEQTAIARILATKHREEQGTVVFHSQVQRVPSNPSRIRVTPHWEASAQPVGDMAAAYNTRGWVAVEFSGDALQPQRFITTQQHNNPSRCRPYYPPYASHDGQVSLAGCGHSLEIIPSNRISSNTRKLVPVQLGGTHLIAQSRQEVPAPLNEHQRDEEEWFRSAGPGLSSRPGTIGSSIPGRPTPTTHLYNPTNWPHSVQWLNMAPTASVRRPHGLRAPVSLAPPVRVRSAVAVSSAPPRTSRCEEHQKESPEDEAATCKVLNEINSLKLE